MKRLALSLWNTNRDDSEYRRCSMKKYVLVQVLPQGLS